MEKVINSPNWTELIESLPEPLRKAQQAINLAEVQEMIKKLGEYGLGVTMPHMHDSEGHFQALPDHVISFENELKVSFMDASHPSTDRALPISWRWDEKLQAIAYCNKCGCWSC